MFIILRGIEIIMAELTHQQIICKLERRLERMGLEVNANKEFRLKNRDWKSYDKVPKSYDGEIDVYGIDKKKKRIIAIEVKETLSDKGKTSAHRQLRQDIFFLKEDEDTKGFNIITMFAYGEHNSRGYFIKGYKPN